MSVKDWSKPVVVDEVLYAFPANVVGSYLPPWEDIPDKFKNRNHPMAQVQSAWFYKGLPDNVEFYTRKGVDAEMAFRQLSICQRSFEPKHEHKEN